MKWIYTQPLDIPLNLSNVSLGGTSAGANLAIVLALKLAEDPTSFQHPLTGLILIVPVIDNTATLSSSSSEEKSIWWENQNAPWLTPTRMLWYRDMYIPSVSDRASWSASPNLAPAELLASLPKTWIATAECDLLAPEALAFAGKLEVLGVQVERYEVKGGTHSCLALNGVLGRGMELVEDAVGVVRAGFER
jgi:acetyl esterase/lipase